jgi:aminoglycoside/choline kinase family phosphotransferase
LERDLGFGAERLAPASADASFRRYFRIWRRGETFIAMDAPPGKEDLGPYISVTHMLRQVGVHVPRLIEEDRSRGFLLLSDLGVRPYLDELRADLEVDRLYDDALQALSVIQSRGAEHAARLKPYDRGLLLAEMRLMPEWFCTRHLHLELTNNERVMLERCFEFLCDAALAQAQVFVHRDYHSRNLMVCPEANPGILDFQDAVCGPVTYDLVSLLKDCYVRWPRERVAAWVAGYRRRAQAADIAVPADDAAFLRDFDWMGAQRHIKVLGIFARLFHRDGKPGYLGDLPRTLNYVREVCELHREQPELAALQEFFVRRVLPVFDEQTGKALVQGAR